MQLQDVEKTFDNGTIALRGVNLDRRLVRFMAFWGPTVPASPR
jgi:hypothetical protein